MIRRFIPPFITLVFALLLAGCNEGTEIIVAQPVDVVIKHLQRQLASTPAWKNLQFQKVDKNRSVFTYLQLNEKTWKEHVYIFIQPHQQETTRIVIRYVAVSSGFLTNSSSTERLPDAERKIQQDLFPLSNPR